MLKNLLVFHIVFSGLLSVKWAVVHNEIETALEVLCSSKINFQFLEMNFKNKRTVSKEEWEQYFPGKPYCRTFPDLPVPTDVQVGKACPKLDIKTAVASAEPVLPQAAPKEPKADSTKHPISPVTPSVQPPPAKSPAPER